MRRFIPYSSNFSCMAFLVILLFGLSGLTVAASPAAPQSGQVTQENPQVVESYGKLPLYFIENKGQMDDKVKFYEKGAGHSTFFTKEGVLFSLRAGAGKLKGSHRHEESSPVERPSPPSTVELRPMGISPTVEITAQDPQEGRVNYLIGNDPKHWKSNLPTYRSILYKGAYPGVDIKFYGNNRQLEYDLIVNPGADPSKVQFQYSGIEGMETTEGGDLRIKVKEGLSLTQRKPVVYQVIDGKRIEREGRFRSEKGEHGFIYGFEVASYDRDHTLVIDPYLIYSTYLGGSGDDYGYSIAVDSEECAYVTGYTASADFPVENPYDSSYQGGNGGDVFVTKFSTAGDTLVYSTYIGGSASDYGHGIAVDSSKHAYVTGITRSPNFPTVNPFQASKHGKYDAFILKLSSEGDTLVYSTYMGGSSKEIGYAITVDSFDHAYITGMTQSLDFPTQNACKANPGQNDAFILKLSPEGDTLVYSTYMGGSLPDEGTGIAVDSYGYAYVTGTTKSPGLATPNTYQTSIKGSHDVFVLKLSLTGDSLVYLTYVGGSLQDYGAGIAIDASGFVYVTGRTASDDFPVLNAYQPQHGGGSEDAFVLKLDPSFKQIVYSTYLGGEDADSARAISLDLAGNAYVAGITRSSHFPLWNPLQWVRSGYFDVFVTKINAHGTGLVYSTLLGGNGDDMAYGIASGFYGEVYVTGRTRSDDFPLETPFQSERAGNIDAFVAKIRNSTPKITVRNPNGGDIWWGGTTRMIRWSSDYVNGTVKIELTRDGGSTWQTPFSGMPNQGSIPYLVSGPSTKTARIRVSSATTPDIQDESNSNFAIASIQLISPNGSEVWPLASTKLIRWNSSGFNRPVKISLSRDGGNSWETLIKSTPDDGSEPWIVTGPSTQNARISISSLTNSHTRDVSDSDFIIPEGSLKTVYPNGGELFSIGSKQTIRWNASGFAGGVKIQLSRDGGKNWEGLFSSTANDGEKVWKVTGPSTGRALIRIKSVKVPRIMDVSDSEFSIH